MKDKQTVKDILRVKEDAGSNPASPPIINIKKKVLNMESYSEEEKNEIEMEEPGEYSWFPIKGKYYKLNNTKLEIGDRNEWKKFSQCLRELRDKDFKLYKAVMDIHLRNN